MTDPTDERRSESEDWQEGLLARIRLVMFAVFGFSAFMTMYGTQSDKMQFLGFFTMFASAALLAILFTRRIPLQWRSLAATVAVAVTAWVSYFSGGFLAGPAVSIAFALIVAALLFGQRTFVSLLIAFGVLPLIGIFLMKSGQWPGPVAADFDPENTMTWIRTGIISIVLWTAIGLSVLFVKGTIERNLLRNERALSEKEAALEQLQEEIADRKAAERARREAEQMAAQAQKLDAIGRLAAGIAHDFNNALLVIQGWNDMQDESETDDDKREAKESIAQAVHQGAYLARQLLAFARKDVRAPKYLVIDDIVQDTAKTLQRLLPAGIELTVDTNADVAVFADEAQLQQVLLNLVINARDALPEGGEICIRTTRSAPPEQRRVDSEVQDEAPWVLLEVEDNGIGMDDDVKSLALEPFFTTKDRAQGTGLGLSTVFGIMRQSDGHLEIRSEPDRGTTISLFFLASELSMVGPTLADTVIGLRDLSARVLLVEDDPLALKLIIRSLERRGMHVTSCENGDVAVATMAENATPFDILCSDAVFPGASLSDVISTFRSHSPDAPILVCSGYVREEIAITGVESGEWEFLAKPFSNKSLVRKIHSLLHPDPVD